MENNQQSFYQFSDQLRGQASNLANLSLNDPLWSNNSIWSNTYVSKRTDERRNSDVKLGGEVNLAANLKPKSSDVNGFDIRVGGEVNSKPRSSDFNGFNNNWDVRVGGDVNSAAGLKPRASDFNGFNNNWDVRVGGDVNSAANLKPRASDFNGFNNNWDIRGGGDVNSAANLKPRASNFNGFNDNWKMGMGNGVGYGPIGSVPGNNAAVNGGFNKGIYSTGNNFNSFNIGNSNFKGIKNRGNDFPEQQGGKNSKKNNNKKNNNSNNNDNEKTAAEKRFKTLPPAEALPRNETIGGYIFVCNNDTMSENLQRQLFGLPPRYRDSVRAITPGLPLFLYNYSTHQLHGIFEAASFGGTNIDSTAWEDKKSHGESRFPAQVRVITRKICVPLEEDSFRPILHHYDGPKFRLELSVPEAISLLDVFAEQNSLDIFGEENQ